MLLHNTQEYDNNFQQHGVLPINIGTGYTTIKKQIIHV
jgi:hypothetical protein